MREICKTFNFTKIHYGTPIYENGELKITDQKSYTYYNTRPIGDRKARMILSEIDPELVYLGKSEHTAKASMSLELFVKYAEHIEYENYITHEGEMTNE